ncbi:hypothetical protein ACRCUN_23430 [Mycobacterium sp. LTG2003]
MTSGSRPVEAPSFTDLFLIKIGVRLPHSWDPALPVLGQCVSRMWLFCSASRLRYFTLLPVALYIALAAFGLMFPAEAHAYGEMAVLGALLPVTDSYGVSLWDYQVATDHGGLFKPGNALMGGLLSLEGAIFVTIGGFAIWLLVYILSFGFLRDLVLPMAEGTQAYASQILPGVAVVAGLIAAVVIAMTVIRGDMPKAVGQASAALLVALVAGAVAYSPVSWAVSDDGPIVQGRDLAISAATNSAVSSGHATDTLGQLEGMLATNLVRRPLQALNFGALPDDTPACATAWSSGVNSGEADRIKDNVRDCGAPNSAGMKARADNPGAGQVGAGLLLLAFMTVFLLYAVTTAFRIIAEFMRAIVSALKMMWGLAVGLIPGPGQRSIYTAAVEFAFAALAMFAYVTATMFVGEMFSTIFRQQANVIVSTISSITLTSMMMWLFYKLGRHRRKNAESIADNILDGLGATKPPPGGGGGGKSSYIPGGFLYNEPRHGVGTALTLGITGTLTGEAIYKASPTAGKVMRRFASFYPAGPMQTLYRGLDDASSAKAASERDKKADGVAAGVNHIRSALGPQAGPNPSGGGPTAAPPPPPNSPGGGPNPPLGGPTSPPQSNSPQGGGQQSPPRAPATGATQPAPPTAATGGGQQPNPPTSGGQPRSTANGAAPPAPSGNGAASNVPGNGAAPPAPTDAAAPPAPSFVQQQPTGQPLPRTTPSPSDRQPQTSPPGSMPPRGTS